MHSKIYNSRILVTGGAGFIGSHVVEELLPLQPREIIIVDNLIRGSLYNMQGFRDHQAITFVQGDIRDNALIDELMAGVDFVFHMAALRINACAANPQDGFDVMLKATFNLVESCRRHGVKKIIYSSSASVYGLASTFPTPEWENPYDNQTFYGGAKLWGEQLLRSYKHMYGLEHVALRYFNVYGPRMDTDGKYTEVMIKWLDCIREGRAPLVFGDGSTTMDFVHVRDVARANVAALLSSATNEAFNVGNCEEVSLAELLAALLRVNGSSLVPEHRAENTVNPVSRRLAANQKAQLLLDFVPLISLEEGLKELSEWYFERKESTLQTETI